MELTYTYLEKYITYENINMSVNVKLDEKLMQGSVVLIGKFMILMKIPVSHNHGDNAASFPSDTWRH